MSAANGQASLVPKDGHEHDLVRGSSTHHRTSHELAGGSRDPRGWSRAHTRRTNTSRGRAESEELSISPQATCSDHDGMCQRVPRKARWYTMSTTESDSPQQPSCTKESGQKRSPFRMQLKGGNISQEVTKLVTYSCESSAKPQRPLEARAKVLCEHTIHEDHIESIT